MRYIGHAACFVALLLPTLAAATPYVFSYGGRIAASDGTAVAGPVDLQVRFYRTASGGTPIGDIALNYAGVPLSDGVFQVDINLSNTEFATVFAGDADVYAEVRDSAGTNYPRQQLTAVPYALQVPVDNASIVFNNDNKLAVGSVAMSQITGLSAALAGKADSSSTTLGGDISGSLSAATVSKLQGRSVSAAAPTSQQVLQWSGSQWTPATLAASGNGTVTNVTATAPLTVTSGTSTPAISITQASSGSAGYLSASDWSHFNNKQSAMSAASSSVSGFLQAADWSLFNSKQAALGYVPLSTGGGAMSGVLNMSSQKISSLGEPTTASDAATKNYVDNNLGGVNFDQTSRAHDYVVKWDNAASKFMLAADQVGSAGGGITNFNGLNASSQSLAIGSSGTSPAFSSTTSTHTLNIPMANTASVTAGLLSNAEYVALNSKVGTVTSGTGISVSTSGTTATVNLANTAVTAGTYTRANITVDPQGRLTAASNGANVNLASEVTGTLPVANGGTGSSLAGTARANLGAAAAGSNFDITSLSGLTTALSIGQGGTGATTAAAARSALSAAASGANSDITALSGLTTALSIGQGGTGATTAAAARAALGLGTLTEMSGNLGIGTATPNFNLHLSSGTANTSLGISNASGHSLLGMATTDLILQNQHATGALKFDTNSVNRMTITSTGMVGIGTTAPAALLHVNGTTKLGIASMTMSGIQFGMTAGASGTVNFSPAFNSAPFVALTPQTTNASCGAVVITSVSSTSFNYTTYNLSTAAAGSACNNIHWIAIAP